MATNSVVSVAQDILQRPAVTLRASSNGFGRKPSVRGTTLEAALKQTAMPQLSSGTAIMSSS